MRANIKTTVVLIAFLLTAVMSYDSQAGDIQPSALELARLPKFCWAQFKDPIPGPEYRIPKGCGYAMNHYCYGLIYLHRAKNAFGDKSKRIGNLDHAKSDTLYTIAGMKDWPNCPIRGHVENTLNEIQLALRGLGRK